MKRNLLLLSLVLLALIAFTASLATEDLYLGSGGKAVSIVLLLTALRSVDTIRPKAPVR